MGDGDGRWIFHSSGQSLTSWRRTSSTASPSDFIT